MNWFTKTVVMTLCAATLVQTVCAGTQANLRVSGRSVVRYGDLNLAIERDAKKMLARIDRAAIAACGGWRPFGLNDGLRQMDFEKCRADAVASAVRDLGAPLVTSIYANSNSSNIVS